MDGETSAVAVIESLDHEARGVARVSGKVVFIDGALVGESVRYAILRQRKSHDLATAVDIVRPSPGRVVPRCPHFRVCGGCSMQHLDVRDQVAVKQRILEDNLWHIARLRPEIVYRPVQGPSWNYRRRARLSVRDVERKGEVLVGFHERHSSFVADMSSCSILPEEVSALLVPLRRLIESLTIRRRIPQVEVSAGEGRTQLVLRVLDPASSDDERALAEFASAQGVDLWLQPRGPDSAQPISGAAASGIYRLPEYGLELEFLPTDFVQVNFAVNRVLVHRALALLDLMPDDRVGDMFSGLGNFSLPIATRARAVVAIEGNKELLRRAEQNARRAGLATRLEFVAANLFEVRADALPWSGAFDKVLLDPPREGAIEVVKALASNAAAAPSRIAYVSCNPSTLARDAAVLVNEGGYRLAGAGVVNMFPHTSHVESMALFVRADR